MFVDIGGNVGQHALWMSQFSESVYAFEPWHPVREKLEKKVRVNDIKNASVYAVGLGDEEGKLSFLTPPDIIKLDVEGFEAKVLLGLEHILRECRPKALLEFSPTTQEQFSSYAAFLEIFPYKVTVGKVVALDNWHYTLEPFNFEECSDILIKPI